jgi:hypothetical protein
MSYLYQVSFEESNMNIKLLNNKILNNLYIFKVHTDDMIYLHSQQITLIPLRL